MSTITRLIGGGFAIDEGAIVGGYQWTLGDLSNEELALLWAMARQVGASRTALVTENPDYTAGLNERIHWGLMKFDVYERFAPGANRYPLSIADWG